MDGRKPRVKSNIAAKKQQKKGNGGGDTTDNITQSEEKTTTKPILKIIPDGRAPRVKANLRSGRTFGKKFNNGGHDSKEDDHKSSQQNGRRGEEKSGTGRRNGRRLDVDDNVDFKQNEIDEDPTIFKPEVRPDGRTPRVKSNLRAKKAFSGNRDNSNNNSNNNNNNNNINNDKNNNNKKNNDENKANNNNQRPTKQEITTFRPRVDLAELLETTLSPRLTVPLPNPLLTVPLPNNRLTVPLPNIKEVGKSEEDEKETEERRQNGGRFSGSLRPTPRGLFSHREPAFSDYPERKGPLQGSKMVPGRESVTEIVSVFLTDRSLFEDEFELDYYDYYDDKRV